MNKNLFEGSRNLDGGIFSIMKRIIAIGVLVVFAATGSAKSEQKDLEESKLSLAVLIEVKPRLEAYLKVRNLQVGSLVAKYERVISGKIDKAANAGDLKNAEAFNGENESLEKLKKILAAPLQNLIDAVKKHSNLPELDSSTPLSLVALRKVWTAELQKIRSKLDGELQHSLKKLETDWTKARDFKNAKEVLILRESLLPDSLKSEMTMDSPAAMAAKVGGDLATSTATIESPFENSLGMRFVPLPIVGGSTNSLRVLISIWETRVKDYEQFIRKNRQIKWSTPPHKQKSSHPAVNVSWDEAVAFCDWLTIKERAKGILDINEAYRLPTDHEWSCAVGIGTKENAEASPISKNRKIEGVFPWGEGFPPPLGSGNYNGEETDGDPLVKLDPIVGYNDGFVHTSPVGSFNPNRYGLYDLGGNVWEWCQDWFIAEKTKVFRGGAYIWNSEPALLSSNRGGDVVAKQIQVVGFRVVIAPVQK